MNAQTHFSNENRVFQAADVAQPANKAHPFDISQLMARSSVAQPASATRRRRYSRTQFHAPVVCTGPVLPGSAQEIADVIGTERALYLIGQLPRCVSVDRRYPGAKSSQVILYVPTPARLRHDHDLVRILGLADALHLCHAFSGELMKPPNCAAIRRDFHHRALIQLAGEGTSDADLAEIFSLSRRRVRTLKALPPSV